MGEGVLEFLMGPMDVGTPKGDEMNDRGVFAIK